MRNKMCESVIETVIRIISNSEKSIRKISRESGVARSTIESWIRSGVSPSILNLESVLTTIGYTLILQKTEISEGGNFTECESDTMPT